MPVVKQSFMPAISVAGNTTACFIGDELVASTIGLNPSLYQGGIGLRTWDAVPNQTAIRVNQVRVTATSSTRL